MVAEKTEPDYHSGVGGGMSIKVVDSRDFTRANVVGAWVWAVRAHDLAGEDMEEAEARNEEQVVALRDKQQIPQMIHKDS